MKNTPTQPPGRSLTVLVPLIRDELEAGDDAGLEHYRRAGEMLLEAKSQVAARTWGVWLSEHFELSRMSAWRYMKLAEAEAAVRNTRVTAGEARPAPTSLRQVIKVRAQERAAHATIIAPTQQPTGPTLVRVQYEHAQAVEAAIAALPARCSAADLEVLRNSYTQLGVYIKRHNVQPRVG